MLPDARAVVFDLDDTLYPYRQFVLSGFASVAAHLEAHYFVNRRRAYWRLVYASTGPARGREFEACLDEFGLPQAVASELVEVLRAHRPSLRLAGRTLYALQALRADGWKLGVLTNGPAKIQRRKIAALGLESLIDAVVFATEIGSGAGKPEREPFDAICHELRVPASHVVFVGNDVRCDVEGSASAGMLPVLCTAWSHDPAAAPDVPVVNCLSRVPQLARARLQEALHHAA